jgi:hypothetical protein
LRPFPHVAEQQFTKRSVSIGIEKAKELSKTEKPIWVRDTYSSASPIVK